ncbi:hypothetical protein B9Z19DRAFT_674797 [Tuber borchii]|uniref:Thioredoxin domain-containing protein n=1 Tax=Tuber borchii TaxID=42251 RepID=A0A2T6ZAH2_TUBBO|nr:hypothetical protein B9Z19DRAFT_674797 [Tuber borchii]
MIERGYSPTCPHCIKAAPIWKQLHDKYTTQVVDSGTPPSPNSDPGSPSSSPTFTEKYDFHFANINCVSYGDICADTKVGIEAFPSFILFKDGKAIEQYPLEADRTVEDMSKFVDKYIVEISAKSNRNLALPKTIYDESKNPEGKSVALTADGFLKEVIGTGDGWFVKFYAPWCQHCQALAPQWAELGREMKNQLNIGEVNCENDKRLCKELKVRGYPTIIYFQHGERIEYNGLRGLGDLVSFAKKAVDSSIKEIEFTDFEEMEKGGMEVAFLFFYDSATTTEDFSAMERLPLSFIGHAPLLKTKSDLLARRFRITTWPRLIVVRDGHPSYFPGIAPGAIRDFGRVTGWARSVWLPILPELSAANSHEIMNGKTVVLGILSRDRPKDFAAAKKELKAAALEFMDQRQQQEKNEKQELRNKKQLRIEEAEDRNDQRALRTAKNMKINLEKKKEIGFAWVDGVFWERWVRTTYGVNVAEMGERIIINEEDIKQYWDTTLEGTAIVPSRSIILDTLKAVIAEHPRIRSKSTTNRFETAYYQIRAKISNHPLASWFLLASVVIALAVWGRGRMKRRGTGGFFRLESTKEEGVGGKVD